jgi:hypothetical protein
MFMRIGSADLWAIGAGAILEDEFCIFGARWTLVQSACRQRADTIVGLALMALGMLLQLVAVCLGAFGPMPKLNAFAAVLIALAPAVVVLPLAARTSRWCAVRHMKRSILQLTLSKDYANWRRSVLAGGEGRQGLEEEVRNLLGGLAREDEIAAFVLELHSRIRGYSQAGAGAA